MIRRRLLAPLLALTCLLLALDTSAQTTAPTAGEATVTAPESPERFAGEYRYAESAEAGQRRVHHAASPILRRLNPIMRMLAESRLDDTHVPRRIDIVVDDGDIAIRYVGDEDRTYRARHGHPRTITLDSGREARLTHIVREGQLQQVFEGERGRWYNLFELQDGGRLMLNVVIAGERLEAPLRVSLPYDRAR